jgi:thiamine-phosphate pyrophosphorylase
MLISLVTDRKAMGDRPLVGLIREAAAAGVDLIQIRERDMVDGALADLTRAAVEAVRGTSAKVLVNDRLDVALAAGAAGVHLRADSFGASQARTIAPPGFVIGRSVHDVDEAARTEAEGGCDYLIMGTVFPSGSKPSGHEPSGLSALRDVCARVRLPVIAIGGMSIGHAAAVKAAGAAGVAAIGLFRTVPDLAGMVQNLRRSFDS